MTGPDHKAPAAADPRPGENPGYADDNPRDAEEARHEGEDCTRDDDHGGLDRPVEPDPGATGG
jgi:hypothetical protein